MGVSMDFLMNLIQLGLDAGILALCCEVVFRQKAEIKAKDFFVFPILLVLCVVPRVDFSIGANMTASFRSEGFEILPADNIVGLLFLIFAVLLLSSIFFGSKSSGTVFCGTMAAFSVFLFVKCLCVVLFAVCGATDILLLLGSRAAALCLIVVLEFTPLFGLIHQLVQRSDFTILIVSTNIAVLLMTVLSILSFDVDRLLANLWIINILILAVLLLDSILLFLHQRRIQEQKRIHMIEQYVPIVEELISQVRARQHEFNNRMMAIEAAVTSADTIEEARKEVTALTGSIGISLNDRELLSCDSKMIAGMLFGKIKQAEAANHHIELAADRLGKLQNGFGGLPVAAGADELPALVHEDGFFRRAVLFGLVPYKVESNKHPHRQQITGQLRNIKDDVLVVQRHIGLLIERAGRAVDQPIQDVGKALCFRRGGENFIQVAQDRHFFIAPWIFRLFQRSIVMCDALDPVCADHGIIQKLPLLEGHIRN